MGIKDNGDDNVRVAAAAAYTCTVLTIFVTPS